MGGNHFFEMDLLSGDFTIKPRMFPERTPNFFWLKDNSSIVMLDKMQKKKNWTIRIYDNNTDLLINCLTIKANEVKLIGVAPNGKEIGLQIRNRGKEVLYKANLESQKITRISNLHRNDCKIFYWTRNDKLFYCKEDTRRNKIESIWSINSDGTGNEPFFEELQGTTEKITGITADGRQIALNIIDNGKIKSGILTVQTGEIQYLPSIKESIQTISSTGKEIITIDQESSCYYLYKTTEDEKWQLPIDRFASNLQFCIDDEFLIYTKYTNNKPIVELFDLVTLEKNYLFDMKNHIGKVEIELVIF